MRLILLGAPGAGKGTQASHITQNFNIPQISTGDMLRAMARSGTEFGNQLKKVMETGGLVSDDIIIKTVQQRLEDKDCSNGYLFDGFPRTIAQAEALKTNKVKLDYVVEFDVPEEEIILRVTGRWVHQQSNRIYHTVFNPPKVAGKDDITGEDLIQRPDDTEATVRRRLEVYRAETFPLIAYYKDWQATKDPEAPKFVKISGVGTVEEIKQRILSALK